jgi:hypothetical protein
MILLLMLYMPGVDSVAVKKVAQDFNNPPPGWLFRFCAAWQIWQNRQEQDPYPQTGDADKLFND